MDYLPILLSRHSGFLRNQSFIVVFAGLFLSLVVIALVSSVSTFMASYVAPPLFGGFLIVVAAYISHKYLSGKGFRPVDGSEGKDLSAVELLGKMSQLFFYLTGYFHLFMVYVFVLFGLFIIMLPLVVVFGS